MIPAELYATIRRLYYAEHWPINTIAACPASVELEFLTLAEGNPDVLLFLLSPPRDSLRFVAMPPYRLTAAI